MLLCISIDRKTGKDISREYIDDGIDHSSTFDWFAKYMAEKYLKDKEETQCQQ